MPTTESYMKEKGMIPESFDAFNPDDAKLAQRAYMESLLDRSWNKGSEEVKICQGLRRVQLRPYGCGENAEPSKRGRGGHLQLS